LPERRGRTAALVLRDLIEMGWQVRPAGDSIEIAPPLGAGEAAALALASRLTAERVLIDDVWGRQTARRMGLSVKGAP